MPSNNVKEYSPILIRISISLLFLWFGATQIFNPEYLAGYLPDFILASDYANNFLLLNGVFEVVFGLLLLIGLFTKIASLILALHLLGISFSLGYNDIAVRDFILSLVAFSIFLNGKDKLCLDKILLR